MSRSSLLLATLFALSAWASEEPAAKHEAHDDLAQKPAKHSSRDVKIPRALVGRLEREYREYLTQQQVVLKDGIKRKLINVTAELTQKREAALHENVRDLAEHVTPLKGAFNVKILAHRENGDALEGHRVFFVSQAKPRILAGEDIGAGCGKFMEITSFYNQKMNRDGFEVYSTDRRYASVLGGSFVIVSFEKESLGVATVQFTDSRYPDLYCE